MLDLLSLTPEAARHAVVAWLARRGEPQYRASQIVPRLWHRPVGSWDQATDLPAELRGALAAAFPLRRLALSARQRSADGTEKYLWDLGDGEAVESVLIPEGKRRTLCVSSQVGCALGCVFCATGRMGFRRNLAAWEIVDQVIQVRDDSPHPVRGVVAMGMGEPLLNYDRVMRAARVMSEPCGLAITARAITISTVGVVPMIRRFTRERQPYRLVVSLTAADHDLRRRLLPIEDVHPLPELMSAVREYQQATGERVMLAWTLLSGVNTRPEDARRL